jgi:hypothetical protein
MFKASNPARKARSRRVHYDWEHGSRSAATVPSSGDIGDVSYSSISPGGHAIIDADDGSGVSELQIEHMRADFNEASELDGCESLHMWVW